MEKTAKDDEISTNKYPRINFDEISTKWLDDSYLLSTSSHNATAPMKTENRKWLFTNASNLLRLKMIIICIDFCANSLREGKCPKKPENYTQ